MRGRIIWGSSFPGSYFSHLSCTNWFCTIRHVSLSAGRGRSDYTHTPFEQWRCVCDTRYWELWKLHEQERKLETVQALFLLCFYLSPSFWPFSFCGLFHKAVGMYTMYSQMVGANKLIKDLEGSGRDLIEVFALNLLEGLRKATKNLNRYSQRPSRDTNQTPHEEESRPSPQDQPTRQFSFSNSFINSSLLNNQVYKKGRCKFSILLYS
jgi:hypothetical protein